MKNNENTFPILMDYSSFQMILALILFIFVSLVLWGGLYIIKRCGNPIPKLIREFDKKMWMTLGLGTVFFGFYFSFIFFLSRLINSENSQNIFSFFYHYKVEAIYIGLLLFTFATSSIYMVRLLIKYLYGKRNGIEKVKKQ